MAMFGYIDLVYTPDEEEKAERVEALKPWPKSTWGMPMVKWTLVQNSIIRLLKRKAITVDQAVAIDTALKGDNPKAGPPQPSGWYEGIARSG